MISLYQCVNGEIAIGIKTGSKTFREYLSPEKAQELSNKLQSFVKGQQSPAIWEQKP